MANRFSRRVRATAEGWYARIFGGMDSDIPRQGNEETVVDFVKALFEESRTGREKSLLGRQFKVQTQYEYSNPVDFWRDCRKLEQGLHWDVFGHRATDTEDTWKQELVDDEIGNQIRVKKAYITANWHDITILPNIANINEIIEQERGYTHWGDMILQFVHRGLTEGTSIAKSVLDRTENVDGYAREIPLDNASVFPTPYCTGFSKVEGCWYICHATMVTLQQILEEAPDVKEELLALSRIDITKDISMQDDVDYVNMNAFIHTKFYDRYEVWMDDPAIVPIGAEGKDVDTEHQAIVEGVNFEAKDDQDHIGHIEAHIRWLEETIEPMKENPETAQEADAIGEVMGIHLGEHYKKLEDRIEHQIPPKSRPKYPHGRLIVVAGGLVIKDAPNPFHFDWRKLWHKWENEKLPGHLWGRGVAEVLWETNRGLDTLMSRTADVSISVGMPKVYLEESNKDLVKENGIDNDPTHPAFVRGPISIRQGQSPRENILLFNLLKENAKKQQGVSEVSYGQTPSARASGKLVEVLRRQNTVLITGEANQRLNDVIEDMIETRMLIYKQFYTEPRYYFIDGQPKAINASQVLTKFKIQDKDGKEHEVTIPSFDIQVRPNSNFPQQFEQEFSLVLDLLNVKDAAGNPILPIEALYDVLSQRYPQFGRQGRYYKISEELKVGRQVLAQEKEKEQQNKSDMRMVASRFKQEGLKNILPRTGPGPVAQEVTQVVKPDGVR